MQFYHFPKPSPNPLNKDIGLYEEYTNTDPVTGSTIPMKRVIGYFTLEELRAYSAALANIVDQAGVALGG